VIPVSWGTCEEWEMGMLWVCQGGHAERRQGFGKGYPQSGKGENIVERGRFGSDLSAGEVGHFS